VTPLLTPSAQLTAGAAWAPSPWATLGASGRYLGAAHLDNTGSDAFRAPAFFTLDADASMTLSRWLPFAAGFAPVLRIQATNLLDNGRAYPSGYSYRYFSAGDPAGADAGGTRYYYPMASRGVFVMLSFTR
jgi:hypothetical protein